MGRARLATVPGSAGTATTGSLRASPAVFCKDRARVKSSRVTSIIITHEQGQACARLIRLRGRGLAVGPDRRSLRHDLGRAWLRLGLPVLQFARGSAGNNGLSRPFGGSGDLVDGYG